MWSWSLLLFQPELVCTLSGRIVRHRRQSSTDDSSVDLTYEVHFHLANASIRERPLPVSLFPTSRRETVCSHCKERWYSAAELLPDWYHGQNNAPQTTTLAFLSTLTAKWSLCRRPVRKHDTGTIVHHTWNCLYFPTSTLVNECLCRFTAQRLCPMWKLFTIQRVP